jgi:hypothetical protein
VSAFEPTPNYSALELVRATHDPQQLSFTDNWCKSCGFNLRAGRLVSDSKERPSPYENETNGGSRETSPARYLGLERDYTKDLLRSKLY